MPPIEKSDDVLYEAVWAWNYLVEKNGHGSSRIILFPGVVVPQR